MPVLFHPTTGLRSSNGGGRLLGEACHFVDLLRYLAASPIDDINISCLADSKPCQIPFLSASLCQWLNWHRAYFSNGSNFPRARGFC